MSARQERAETALAEIVRLFESGELPAAVARTTITRLESDAPSAAWSLGNRILMLLAGTDDARGFRQWEAAGRKVKKGAKAFSILAPATRKIREQDDAGDEQERVIVTGFLGIPVFRIEDSEGEPVERPDYTPAELPALIEVAERLGVNVRWLPFVDRFYGAYVPGRGEIVLCTHDAATFWHELAHAAHERACGTLKRGQDSRQEIVAESVAAVLARLYDFSLDTVAMARRYVEGYSKGENPGRAVMRVIADVQATLDLILTTAETPAEEVAAAA